MNILNLVFALLIGYLVGSIPTGYLLVRLFKGEDVRHWGSGRTGGTNVGRALGTWAGVLTAILDGIKAVIAVIIVRQLLNHDAASSGILLSHWIEVLGGFGAVVGHNWPLFLSFQGGAGTSANVGAATALWVWAFPISLVTGVSVLFLSSYASLGSIVVALCQTLAFLIRAVLGAGPWEHVAYSGATTLLVLLALRPNIRRIKAGSEREIQFGLKHLTK